MLTYLFNEFFVLPAINAALVSHKWKICISFKVKNKIGFDLLQVNHLI